MIITQNIHSHWKSHDRKSRKPVIIFSPYLTSPIPQEILEQSRRGKIYTLFKVELFASKASDISIIKKLKELGHEIFQLENLHAKIVIKQDEFATIGSQNATYKGIKNLELSALFTDNATISEIGAKVNFWIKKAKPITSSMITDMESAVSLLRENYNAFQNECRIAQKKIDQAAELAQMCSDKKKNERFQKRLKTEIKRVIAMSPTSKEEHRATIKYRKRSNETSLFSEGKNLLNWTINDTPMTFKVIKVSLYN